jgi:hypothetical protein
MVSNKTIKHSKTFTFLKIALTGWDKFAARPELEPGTLGIPFRGSTD